MGAVAGRVNPQGGYCFLDGGVDPGWGDGLGGGGVEEEVARGRAPGPEVVEEGCDWADGLVLGWLDGSPSGHLVFL